MRGWEPLRPWSTTERNIDQIDSTRSIGVLTADVLFQKIGLSKHIYFQLAKNASEPLTL